MTVFDVISTFSGDDLDRLRWLVLCKFRVLPGSKRAKEVSDEDILFCGAHMLIDSLPDIERTACESGSNADFDIERYNTLLEEHR